MVEFTTEEAEPQIELYSVALWKLYLWLRKAIELRMKDYETRVQEIKGKREEREEKIKQSLEDHAAMKEEAMQAAKLVSDLLLRNLMRHKKEWRRRKSSTRKSGVRSGTRPTSLQSLLKRLKTTWTMTSRRKQCLNKLDNNDHS